MFSGKRPVVIYCIPVYAVLAVPTHIDFARCSSASDRACFGAKHLGLAPCKAVAVFVGEVHTSGENPNFADGFDRSFDCHGSRNCY